MRARRASFRPAVNIEDAPPPNTHVPASSGSGSTFPVHPRLAINSSPSAQSAKQDSVKSTNGCQGLSLCFYDDIIIFKKIRSNISASVFFFIIIFFFFANPALSVKTEWSSTTLRRLTAAIIINYAGLHGINEIRTVCLIKLMHGCTRVCGAGPGFMDVLGAFGHVCKSQ